MGENRENFTEKGDIWARFSKYDLEENPERRSGHID